MYTTLYFVCLDISLVFYRCCKLVTDQICAHGKPCATILTDGDLALFAKASLSVPTNSTVTQYSKLHLVNFDRVITSKIAYRGFLRDNSGIVFLQNGIIQFGRFHKLLLFEHDGPQLAYAIIQSFAPTNEKLCSDSISNCQIDNHIISLHSPRLVLHCQSTSIWVLLYSHNNYYARRWTSAWLRTSTKVPT